MIGHGDATWCNYFLTIGLLEKKIWQRNLLDQVSDHWDSVLMTWLEHGEIWFTADAEWCLRRQEKTCFKYKDLDRIFAPIGAPLSWASVR